MAIVDELHRPAQKPAFGIDIVALDFSPDIAAKP
jgi:hypothetical protein